MPGPDPPGLNDRQAMDPEALALVQQAERGIRRLLQHPHTTADWDAQIRSLIELQAIAATLVNAARLHAEYLSRQAGSQIDRSSGP